MCISALPEDNHFALHCKSQASSEDANAVRAQWSVSVESGWGSCILSSPEGLAEPTRGAAREQQTLDQCQEGWKKVSAHLIITSEGQVVQPCLAMIAGFCVPQSCARPLRELVQ